nr:hypothetical transcript [Hymenolepis microstoma]CUU99302.1 hypothetical transcript [Hymenolepis microstoma]
MMQNLHRISRKMPFGHTDYIPPDETRNFMALVPISDEIKTRLSTIPKVSSGLHSSEAVTNFEEYVKSNPLPAPNYRELQWSRKSSRSSRLHSIYSTHRPSDLKQWDLPGESRNLCPEENDKIELDLSEIESKHRGKYGIPFRIDPIACHIFDEPIGIAHTKHLKLKFGLDKVMLNDPEFMEKLQKKIQNEEKMKEEEAARKREANEVSRAAAEKKKICFASDEYFEAMHFPQICGAKPWLWQCVKGNEITGDCLPEDMGIELPPIRPKCDFESNRQKYVQLWADNNTVHWDLSVTEDVSRNSRQDSTIADEPMEDQEQKTASDSNRPQEPSDKIDQMDEVLSIAQLYKAAKEIVNNYSMFTRYSVISENPEVNVEEEQVEDNDFQSVNSASLS